MRLSEDNLRGRTVMGAEGAALGEIMSLVLDSESWRVEALNVRLDKQIADRLGVDRSLFHSGTLELPTKLVHSIGDVVVLSVSLEQLRRTLSGEAQEPVQAH